MCFSADDKNKQTKTKNSNLTLQRYQVDRFETNESYDSILFTESNFTIPIPISESILNFVTFETDELLVNTATGGIMTTRRKQMSRSL